jgi:anti-sigma factor (TIGR02949 family)
MTEHADIPCEHVIQRVWDYLDGEIDAGQKERIRRHLELCDHCRDQYTFEGAFLRSMSRLLDADGSDHVVSLRGRVEAALIEHGFPKPL